MTVLLVKYALVALLVAGDGHFARQLATGDTFDSVEACAAKARDAIALTRPIVDQHARIVMFTAYACVPFFEQQRSKPND